MGRAEWFWLFLVGSLIWGCWPVPEGPNGRYWRWGPPILWALLFALLGWSVYGPPLKG